MIVNCIYLNKFLGCDCPAVKKILGRRLRRCVKVESNKETCEFKKEIKKGGKGNEK